MLVSLTALLLTSAAFVSYEWITLRHAAVRTLSSQAEMIGFNVASALLFDDKQAAQDTLAALRAEPDVVTAGLYARSGQKFASYLRDEVLAGSLPDTLPAAQPDAHEFKGHLRLYRRILFRGESVGILYIESGLGQMRARLSLYALIVPFALLVSSLVAFGIASRIGRLVSDPILRLTETAKIVSSEKNYAVRAEVRSRDEVGLLTRTFNEMLTQIEQRDTTLQEAQDDLEHRVKVRTAELEAINAELEAFTYSVSHDLRAPLRHIDGFSQILVQEYGAQLDSQAQHYLRRVRDGAQHMGRLVDDLLNLSRVGRGDLNLQLAGLNSIVDEALRDLKPETDGRKIAWQIARLPFVECDAGLTKQVFANLLSNALKYTRPREKAEIEVGQKSENGETVIFVRDNGVGFNMKYADKLFGIFQRLHRSEDFEGTGVGLATVQRIITRHDGRVWAEAELDKGATFFFTLGQPVVNGQKTNASSQILEVSHGRSH